MALTTGLAAIVPLTGTGGSHAAGAIGGPFMFAPIGFLLVLLLVGAIGYLVYQSGQRGGDTDGAETNPALDTLRRRYANGEIDDEEFQTRKQRLQG